MSGNIFGTIFRVTTFGESHGPAIGCVIDGCPAGLPLTAEDIASELRRRRPGSGGPASTSRVEEDIPEILSGLFEGKTLGTPIAIIIRNTNQHSADYDNLKDTYRPGHADWTWEAKYGFRDHRGGGRASGRETAGRVAAGAVAKKFLLENGIIVQAREEAAVSVTRTRIEELKAAEDSAGGIVSCVVSGVPPGLGEPVFDKLSARLAAAVLSIGAAKGIEFGTGFSAAASTGSANNDTPLLSPAQAGSSGPGVSFKTNNAGGMLGGISNGMDIEFRAAFKPVASIGQKQETVDRGGKTKELIISGRHDVCILPRVVPVVEAMTALVLADLLLQQRSATKKNINHEVE
jgi:chorismate synthase